MLLPTELETAISPKPFRATITDVIKSGIDVPAAKVNDSYNVLFLNAFQILFRKKKSNEKVHTS